MKIQGTNRILFLKCLEYFLKIMSLWPKVSKSITYWYFINNPMKTDLQARELTKNKCDKDLKLLGAKEKETNSVYIQTFIYIV